METGVKQVADPCRGSSTSNKPHREDNQTGEILRKTPDAEEYENDQSKLNTHTQSEKSSTPDMTEKSPPDVSLMYKATSSENVHENDDHDISSHKEAKQEPETSSESFQQTISSGRPKESHLQISVGGKDKPSDILLTDNVTSSKNVLIKDENDDHDISSHKEAKQETETSSESFQQTISSGRPKESHLQISVGGKDIHMKDENKDQDISSHKEAEQEPETSSGPSDISLDNETSSKNVHIKDENEDQDISSHKEAEQEPETSSDFESLQQSISAGRPKESHLQISVGGNDKLLWICAVCVLLVAVVFGFYQNLSDPSGPPKQFNVVDVFNQEMEKLQTSFPNQRPELWRRSLIHLRRHLKTERPTEPVSLVLTSGHGAERTLGCLAQCLARAFSTAKNSSVLTINGKSKASQDSDQVKMDIDSELRKAFEGQMLAAVIHRFEELPPGSTLIFYRYCDHENAAFKNVFLAFTIMLDAEAEVASSVSLGRVEDMVYDHLKQKFVSSSKTAMFNEMDVDKLSGLWSRISHLILPVVAEEKIEQQGCVNCDKSF